MKDRYFFDTNIIAYAFDRSDRARWGACRKLVREGFQGESACFVSNQVLAELFVVLTTRVGEPVSREKASTIVRSFIDSTAWKKLNYDHGTVGRAVMDSVSTSHFWDLLIAETMKEAGVKRIYTENARDFVDAPWVEPINPLRSRPPRLARRGPAEA